MENVRKWEPEIAEELEKPATNLETVNLELDNIRVSSPIRKMKLSNHL